jgi:hypothetical protein
MARKPAFPTKRRSRRSGLTLHKRIAVPSGRRKSRPKRKKKR